ncbi:GH32 C-terminal domain-containing protein [Paenibacillus lignilyticus]|uniref:GH32 C-terminal domain-containing protein n=1 Tax=Paenibacillus lignilyticus TaxID=1172615 RepID=A0ABS5CFZ5_9BACL|nr:GH32 C-terminal domain-containing protein [Paenibacillus lignilyticus]MBP3964751.1 GH32 C-terminal domain-containing protein [Paenibacillus lignilyticus]
MTTGNAVQVTQRYLNIPIHNDAPLSAISLIRDGVEIKRLELKLASDEVQSWFTWDADAYKGCDLEAKLGNEVLRAEHFVFQSGQSAEERHLYGEKFRPRFHFTARKGWIGEPIDFYFEQGSWHVRYEHQLYENSESVLSGHAISKDLVHWHEADADYDTLQTESKDRQTLSPRLMALPVNGDTTQTKWLYLHEDNRYSVGSLVEERFVAESEPGVLRYGNQSKGLLYTTENGRCILVGFSRGFRYPEMPFSQQMLAPTELKLHQTEQGITVHAEPVGELQNLRIWQRTWSDITLDHEGASFEESLHFRMAPADWPDVRILPPENKPDDITADALDVTLELELGRNSTIEIGLYGIRILLDTGMKTLACQGHVAPLTQEEGKMKLRLLLDRTSMEIFACEGAVAMAVAAEPNYSERNIQLSCHSGGSVKVNALAVYGLRGIWPSPEESRLIHESVQDNTIVYQSDSYTVYSNRVEDAVYGEPPAYVPDRNTIVSPTRAIEEFVWRKNWANDMNRVIDRGSVWHPKPEISMLPAIYTGHATIDAAYNLAADIFYRCGSAEFARKGEEGMWTAGQFQGPGEGFGVWVRDTAHIAMRSGSILDPEGARQSLLFTTKGGLDNGVDGMAMPIVGIWDYYLATGDLTLIKESWHGLKERITKLDGLFDSERGLIPADQATSNDAFPEPECAGFSLATEIYFMEAFRAMSRMGTYMGEPESQVGAWAARGELLLINIQSQYWNEEAGFYTSGPVGSESYEQGYWESAGQEIAMWPRYGVASREQRRSMLSRLPEVAMNEFGVNVFPYRPETNHFCNAAWVVWTSGMAAAAGREGRLDLLTTLIAQQVRNSVMNKTFYEVIDYQTGKAWRWPGQLWHAAGFISYFLLGVLGMEYDEQGVAFAPAVPEMLRDLRLENLRYRKAVFDIAVHGWGTKFAMHCDGQAIQHIPAGLTGKHYLEFWATS